MGKVHRPIISPEALLARMDTVKLCDLRWSLTEPNHGRSLYREGHLPTAVFVDLDLDLAAPPGLEGRHPLPPVDEFAATLGRLGIGPNDEVVVYDDAGGAVAARMWWMLRSIGHEAVSLLDGGYQVWVELGYPIETGEVIPEPTQYPEPEGFTGTADRHQLRDRTILDARAPERYRGEVEPVDPKAGHIPGAVNRPFSANLGPDGRFLDPGALKGIYDDLDRPVVSCGSGVNACHLAVAMVAAGLPMPDLYPGSFSEWSRRDLPVETGG
jgi:thiosulfate/3-mercaptopyruvate sulfurtransferase